MLDPTRAQFDDEVTAADLRALAGQARLEVLQADRPVRHPTYALVDEEFFAARPDVELRVYGHYSGDCDLGFASHLRNVRRFSADRLMHASGVECLAEIAGLCSLSIGIFDLEDFSVLDRVPDTLTELSLGATRSKKPSLAPLERLRALRVLSLEGQGNHIEVVEKLEDLEDLTLRSITTPDLSYLSRLPKLWSLDIKLGGIRSFAGIEGRRSIKYLELWQVLGVEQVDVVGELPGLQNLFLQSLARVTSLPSFERSTALRRVEIQNLKSLVDFSGLQKAPALEEFLLLGGKSQTVRQLAPVLQNPALRRVSAFFGNGARNAEFEQLRAKHGKAEYRLHSPFEYR